MLVRCLGCRDLAGALPRLVLTAGALPRLVLGVVSERASTGQLGGALVWGLGLWPASGARICVGELKA